MKLKKTVAIITLVATLLSLASCGAADGGASWSPPACDLSPAPDMGMADISGEKYTEITENGFIRAEESPESYFSIDVNTASYPNLRNLIERGYAKNISKDAVRIEEMLNYFNYDYEKPTDGEIFKLNAKIFDTPYNKNTKLMTIGLAAKEVEFKETANNLVFLIDTSGSMASEDKLPLVQEAFKLLTEGLNDNDRISIVTYAGSSGVALDGAYGYEKTKISGVIEDLFAAGSTAGSEGITTAYEIAKKHFIEGGNNRVILATDGDFNVGIRKTDELKDFISEKRDTGIYFSVYGVGRGNLNSSVAETLALNGNGTYSYIDSVKEARRALVESLGASLVTVAKDVKAAISFNPEYVESYRLIGYENKLLTEDEFYDEKTDAGEVGAGHTVTVAYEIVMKDGVTDESNIADLKLRYKSPNGDNAQDMELRASVTGKDITDGDETSAFVSAVIEFGLILRNSEYKADADLDTLINRLSGIELTDEYMIEFRELVSTYKRNLDE